MKKTDSQQIKTVIFGASGNSGRCLVKAGLDRGQSITAFVRDVHKLEAVFGGKTPDEVVVVEGDALDESDVARALKGHQAAINATGDSSDPKIFEALCRIVTVAAEEHLDKPKRLWQFGGLPGLDVPHTRIMGIDLPGMPTIFKSHKINYDQLVKSNLDWSFICPGPMFFAGVSANSNELYTTTEEMPYKIARWTKHLPRIFHPFIMRSHLKELIVSYEDVAGLIMDNLSSGGPFSRKRVGIRYLLND